MVTMHPQILKKDGKKEYAILPFDEFVQIQETLQDYEDLKVLRTAISKEKSVKGATLSEAKRKLGIL